MFLGAGVGGSNEIETKELEKVDPKFARVKGLKKKNSPQIKGRRRLKAWHEKSTKRKKVVSQSTRLSEEVEISYVPQMMNYEDVNLYLRLPKHLMIHELLRRCHWV